MNNISIGRYVPYNSFIHKLDPRTKILSLILFMVVIFLNYGTAWTNIIVYFGLLIIIYIIMRIAHVSLRQLFKQLKMMWIMILIIFLINIFTSHTSLEIYIPFVGMIDRFTIPWINLTIYISSLVNTFYIFIRLVLMIGLTLILTSSTKPMDLTYGLEWYLTPLKKIKFPVHEISMMISLALRFIPTLLEETERIMKAQMSRGVDFQNGKLKEKISGIISLIIPLFISSFQRSDELANAMEARGYDPSSKRTRYRVLRLSKYDVKSMIFTILIVTSLIVLAIIKVNI